MSRKDCAHLLDEMRYAARRARANIEGFTRDDFVGDLTHQEAAIMNLFVIGEMASRLVLHHADFLIAHPDLQVAEMRGMRNRIAHGYHLLDLDVGWQTLTDQVPELLEQLDDILSNGETHGQS